MIPRDEALELLLQQSQPAAGGKQPIVQTAGLRLAQPIAAEHDYPAFDRAVMDG
jgi:molybdopterin biosynthesis enzyme